MALVPSAWAEVSVDGLSPELVLFVWDPVREASYSLDLGIDADEFFKTAQSDAGYQLFINVDPLTDAPFKLLRDKGTANTELRWAVAAFGNYGGFDPGNQHSYFTAQSTVQNGTVGVAYANLLRARNVDFLAESASFSMNVLATLNGDAGNPNNFHETGMLVDFARNGSALSEKGQPGYFETTGGGGGGIPTLGGMDVALTSPVGKSSWFYSVTDSSYDSTDFVAVDEFDNLGGDGYWGFIEDSTTGKFVLSYTLAPAFAQGQAVTTAGFARASLTEYQAGLTTNVTTGPQAEFADYVAMSFAPVSAVPEPSAYALFGAGLLGVWLKRRRKD
jgi:hypothetical protein